MDGAQVTPSAARGAQRKIVARWAGFGPYYAMFPLDFARSVIGTYTVEGDAVLDPFAGRGTSIFCAHETGRIGLGVEINALGWIYGCTKLAPAPVERVLERLKDIVRDAPLFAAEADQLAEFFHLCFAHRVRAFLLTARSSLDWRNCCTDRTVMAFILTYLHGKVENGRPRALSNQMRQTKAMAPGYSVAWWIKNGHRSPPEVDPWQFLADRIIWRYKHGSPSWSESSIRLGDCRSVLADEGQSSSQRFRLLLTSPPYRGVTSYYYDQWLRFWLLGEASHPKRDGLGWKTKFESELAYRQLLLDAFNVCAPLLVPDATIYVRCDARPASLDIVRSALQKVFPDKRMKCIEAPFGRPTQTSLFGDHNGKPGEVDLVLTNDGNQHALSNL